MSPLRQRMITQMRCRHFSPRTEESYLHAIEQLYQHHVRMPDRLSRDEVVAFLAHCVHDRKLSRSTVNVYFQACRFLYEQVLERDPLVFKLPKRSRPKTRPQMLSPEECRRVVEAPKGLKHRALLSMVYGSTEKGSVLGFGYFCVLQQKLPPSARGRTSGLGHGSDGFGYIAFVSHFQPLR